MQVRCIYNGFEEIIEVDSIEDAKVAMQIAFPEISNNVRVEESIGEDGITTLTFIKLLGRRG